VKEKEKNASQRRGGVISSDLEGEEKEKKEDWLFGGGMEIKGFSPRLPPP